MKFAASILALATLAAILPAQAKSYKEGAAPLVPANAVTDPLKVIYRISGVADNGDADGSGFATSFQCTSVSPVDEKLRFTIKNFDGSATTKIVTIQSGHTFTASTHGTDLYFEDIFLTPGTVIDQGAAIISATSTKAIFCSAVLLEADTTTSTHGISLHMVRFNAPTGYQEKGEPSSPNAVTDPLKLIYRISGVADNGDPSGSGFATSIHCTNFSNIDEKVAFTIRDFDGSSTTKSATIPANQTFTASTHGTDLFSDDLLLTPGTPIRQGAAVISATSTTTIFCSAMVLEAGNSTNPHGFDLHMVRLHPAPGTLE